MREARSSRAGFAGTGSTLSPTNMVRKLPWPGFAANTDKLSQKAKPEIWSEQAKFKDHADKMQTETQKLLAAAKTNNLDNLKTAFGPTAQSCKACHDSFRNQ